MEKIAAMQKQMCLRTFYCVCVQEFERMRSNAVVSMCEHVANT